MNSKSINRNVWALTLSLCLGVIGYSTLSAQAADPPKAAERKGQVDVETMSPKAAGEKGGGEVETMSPKACDAQWIIGTHSTGWINLGQVGGTFVNKKAACKKLALQNCGRTEVVNLVKNNVPANQGCAGIQVYFDTKVEGKINSKDGYCPVKPSCTCKEWTYNP